MKIYEKPMAMISRFDTEDIMTTSTEGTTNTVVANDQLDTYVSGDVQTGSAQGVIFQW